MRQHDNSQRSPSPTLAANGVPQSPLRQNAAEGHQLLVILNESRLVDTKTGGEWVSRHVGQRGGLPKGIYDLTGAARPALNATSQAYAGNVLHVSPSHVFQLTADQRGKATVVKHDRALFRHAGQDRTPAVGSQVAVVYERGQGRVQDQQHDRSR
ncbi:KfrB domain-containing protein [Methylobacterium radiotolerans]|uniref:KfrB domain-containing protein n=1 Tax=Methylobacterium radiotolerans (strain ATCC 27329 / DSM 1819 / JCM 2831 / NBRC 15690 / NCIMB 10815 / 0-1) TaxID=426355 RepID=B1M9T4_METRJ|nr:KfrB domain-containing protein [Methylobacterium radiotolerans]ACB28259.1 hypothetical protein Mrad2831_6337 [Methylobacterium radiotolerans JCM 2831]GEN01418.1 hypothetical protein MRA01_59570 [Methylobacterium radiotolerans]